MSEPQVKSPGPTNTHCRMTPIIVLAAQYRPTPAGVESTNHEKRAGMVHCIIAFICCCCSLLAAAELRLEEMRCCSHIEANTIATSP